MVSAKREPLTLEVSVKEIALLLVILLSLAGAAVYSVVNFNTLRSDHQQLAASAQMLREQLASREARVDSLQKQVEQRRGALLLIGANSDTMEVSPGSYSDKITIEELQVMPSNDNLLVSFRLVNNNESEQSANGYLVVLAEHDSGLLERYGTFPDIVVLPGNALSFTSGDSYSIMRFKQVDAAIMLGDSPEKYNRLKVLVFDQQGELLLYQDLRLNV
jgi:hypothetical protein